MTRLQLRSEALHNITASAPGQLRPSLSHLPDVAHQHPLHCRSTELSDTWPRTHEPAEQAVCPGSSLSPAQGTRSWKETPEATPAEGLTCCRSSQTVPVPRSTAPTSSWRERAQQPALSSISSSGPDSRCTKAARHTNRWANTTFCSDSWRRAEPGLSLRRARLCRRPWLTAKGVTAVQRHQNPRPWEPRWKSASPKAGAPSAPRFASARRGAQPAKQRLPSPADHDAASVSGQSSCCAPGTGRGPRCLSAEPAVDRATDRAPLSLGRIPSLGRQRPTDSSPSCLQRWNLPLPAILGCTGVGLTNRKVGGARSRKARL